VRLGRPAKPRGDVDVTSFSDLAFLLIVFFVLTTTFLRPQGASVSIPSRTNDPEQKPEDEPPTINLSVDKLLFDGDSLTMEELRERLFEMKLDRVKDDQKTIVLDSSADVPFKRYFRVVTAVARAGGILAILEHQEGDEQGGSQEGGEES
jgi:biopolymer transport protein ExbD